MSRSVRCVFSAFVLVCLAVGSAQALPARPAAFAVPEAASLLDATWDWLAGRLRTAKPRAPREEGATQQQRKYGCGIDPDGKPRPCEN